MHNSFVVYNNSEEYRLLNIEDMSLLTKELICFASKYNLCGNIWQRYISWLIISDENAFSLSDTDRSDSIYKMAMMDFEIFYDLYFNKIPQIPDELLNFISEKSQLDNCYVHIGKLIEELSDNLSNTKNSEEFAEEVIKFYNIYGSGIFGLNKAFYIRSYDDKYSIIPAKEYRNVTFEDLWGYDYQKKELIDNTEKFINGKYANNVLLYGDSGTGKSTCIKALVNRYYQNGLRIIEVNKYQFCFLKEIIDVIRDKPYYFIIYMDDLSFEDFEIEYKYLKAVIEGGIEPNPKNVLIYATSNRRHIVKESWNDRNDMDLDLHHSDTMQEKLSLSDRFGLSINFSKPEKKEYNEIILHLARMHNISISDDELLKLANAWGVSHGGFSGRIAQQFINQII